MNESRQNELNTSVGSTPDHWDRCDVCGCFLSITGDWVGESHYDDLAHMECRNPRCKTNRQNTEESRGDSR